MKMMPWFSTRSSASFTTSSMSTSFLSSSSTRIRRASGTLTVRRFFRFGSMSCSISVKLKSVPSIPWGGCIISIIGIVLRGTSTSTSRSSSFPSRSMPAQLLARALPALVLGGQAFSALAWPLATTTNTGPVPSCPPCPLAGGGAGGSSRSSSRSSARCSAWG